MTPGFEFLVKWISEERERISTLRPKNWTVVGYLVEA